jgi:hypothetical protein
MGHGSARIARAVGIREETIQRLVCGDTTDVSPHLRDTITDLYDAWWDKRPPTHPRRTRRRLRVRRVHPDDEGPASHRMPSWPAWLADRLPGCRERR